MCRKMLSCRLAPRRRSERLKGRCKLLNTPSEAFHQGQTEKLCCMYKRLNICPFRKPLPFRKRRELFQCRLRSEPQFQNPEERLFRRSE